MQRKTIFNSKSSFQDLKINIHFIVFDFIGFTQTIKKLSRNNVSLQTKNSFNQIDKNGGRYVLDDIENKKMLPKRDYISFVDLTKLYNNNKASLYIIVAKFLAKL